MDTFHYRIQKITLASLLMSSGKSWIGRSCHREGALQALHHDQLPAKSRSPHQQRIRSTEFTEARGSLGLLSRRCQPVAQLGRSRAQLSISQVEKWSMKKDQLASQLPHPTAVPHGNVRPGVFPVLSPSRLKACPQGWRFNNRWFILDNFK